MIADKLRALWGVFTGRPVIYNVIARGTVDLTENQSLYIGGRSEIG